MSFVSQAISSAHTQVERAKMLLAEHNIDTSITLEKRWQVFIDAPKYLKESTDKWELEFVYEFDRHQQARAESVVECLADTLACNNWPEVSDGITYATQFAEWYKSAEVAKLKEYILKNNIGYFYWD